jgi:Uma2 family endonuclease
MSDQIQKPSKPTKFDVTPIPKLPSREESLRQLQTKLEPPLLASDPEYLASIEHLITEDDTPVDNVYSEKQQRLLTHSLYASWGGLGEGRPFVALANVGLFYDLQEQPRVPDVMVSVDVRLPDDAWEKRHRSYFVWEYGKPPEVVIEIVSNRVGGEATTKPEIYARIGVIYYVIYDPTRRLSQQRLRVLQLGSPESRELERAWLPGLGLGLTFWQGEFEGWQQTWLRWHDAQGNLLLTGEERAVQAQQEAAQAQREAAHAQQEAVRAQQEAAQAQQENARLRARLQALGIDPDETIEAPG